MFDYFYGAQSEQFAFYRIPKVLFTNNRFRVLSAEAKTLYGILLDRVSLSVKNGWIDQQGRVYIICTIEEIMEDMNCGNKKAIQLLSDLEEKVGLIERKRQGLGKPNLIYVKNFISVENEAERHFLNCQNHTSGSGEITSPEVAEGHGTNTDYNNTEYSDIDSFPSGRTAGKGSDAMRLRTQYEAYFRQSLELDILLRDRSLDQEVLSAMVDLLIRRKNTMKIKQTAAGLMAGILMLGTLSTPCFAYAPDAESTEESQAVQVEEDTASDNSVPLTPDGNLTLVDDIGSSTEAGQQFITLVTKSGNYFYLIIDRNDKGEETVHFLNQVDESDLFALMDEEQLEALRESQDAGSTENEEPEPTPAAPTETEEPEEQEAKKDEAKPMNMLPIAGILLALVACGGSYIMLQAKKKKASARRPDPDADYTEEDEEEYAIPEEDESDPIGDESDCDTGPDGSKE